MTTTPAIVLLHGGGTTGRQWDLVLDHLAHDALAPHVPGRLDRPGDPATLTMTDAMTSLVDDIDAAGFGDVLLVAHSSGGLLVPGLVERLGDRVRAVVWIAASIPEDGGTGMDCMQVRHRDTMRRLIDDAQRTGTPLVTPPEPPERERMRVAYGETLTDEQLDFAIDPVRWVSDTYNFYGEPLATMKLAALPRLYVRTLRDRAVPIALQDEMVDRLPGTPTVALDCGHVPMITMPGTIAALLDGIAADIARGSGA